MGRPKKSEIIDSKIMEELSTIGVDVVEKENELVTSKRKKLHCELVEGRLQVQLPSGRELNLPIPITDHGTIGYIYLGDPRELKLLPDNRRIDPQHVAKIQQSIESNGDLGTLTQVNEKLEIIDQQHTNEARKALKKPARFFIVEGQSGWHAAKMNVYRENWQWYQYLKYYCDNKDDNYLKYKEFAQQYGAIDSRYDPPKGVKEKQGKLTHTVLKMIAMSVYEKRKRVDGKRVTFKGFNEGNLIFDGNKIYYDYANMILDFEPYVFDIRDSKFAQVLIQVIKNKLYNHTRMMTKLQSYVESHPIESFGKPIMKHNKNARSAYKLELEKIYNYKIGKNSNNYIVL